jgi:NADH-quinone oxidoreductase subunit A
MLNEYGHLAILLAFAILFPLGGIVTSYLFSHVGIRPKVPDDQIKTDIYECGLETEGPSWVQFNIRYYNFALLFVLFDVASIFLFPFAVALQQLTLYALLEGVIFVAILCVGLFYAWKDKALEWV